MLETYLLFEMPFYLYFFTHSQVFHKYSLKSPLLLSDFPQIPYLMHSDFLLSSWMETPFYRFTKSLNYSQKIAVPFFLPSVSGHRRRQWFFILEGNWSHRGLPSRLGATCCGCRATGGGHEVDTAGSPELQVTASGASRHEPLWSCWWLGSVTFYDA